MRFFRLFYNFLLAKKLLFLWIASIASIIITFLVIRYKISGLNVPVALHYTVIAGVDLFGSKSDMYKIPIIGTFVLLVNLSVVRLMRDETLFINFLGAVITLIVNVILLVATLFLLKVN